MRSHRRHLVLGGCSCLRTDPETVSRTSVTTCSSCNCEFRGEEVGGSDRAEMVELSGRDMEGSGERSAGTKSWNCG